MDEILSSLRTRFSDCLIREIQMVQDEYGKLYDITDPKRSDFGINDFIIIDWS
jgi:hypothetical protein